MSSPLSKQRQIRISSSPNSIREKRRPHSHHTLHLIPRHFQTARHHPHLHLAHLFPFPIHHHVAGFGAGHRTLKVNQPDLVPRLGIGDGATAVSRISVGLQVRVRSEEPMLRFRINMIDPLGVETGVMSKDGLPVAVLPVSDFVFTFCYSARPCIS